MTTQEIPSPREARRGKSSRRERRSYDPSLALPEKSRADTLLLYVFYPALLLLAISFCAIRPVSEPDVWFHMAFGRYVLDNGQLPPGDIFSFTGEGNDWISTGWGSSLLFHWIFEKYRGAGLAGVVYATMAAIFLGLYFVAVRRFGNRGSIMLVLLPAIFASYLRFTPRPSIFSQLAMTALVLLIATAEISDRARAGRMPRRLWLLVPLVILWANLHGGFLISFAPLGVYGLWKLYQWWKTREHVHLFSTIPLILCLFAWLLNPYGYRILELVGEVEKIPTIKTHLFEWMPLFTSIPEHRLPWPTYFGVVALLGITGWALATRTKQIPWWQVVVIAGFVLLEFKERRHAAMSTYVIAAMLVPNLARIDALTSRSRALIPTLALLGVFFVGYTKYVGEMGIGRGFFKTGRDGSLLPVTAVDYLQENRPPANMFNTYGPGGYLLYFLGPETKVFIDGRFFVYSPDVWHDFLDVQDQRMTIDEACDKYDIKTFFIYTRDNPDSARHLGNRLTARKDWNLVYFGDTYAVFVKETPETLAYTQPRKFEYVNPFDLERLKTAVNNPSTREAAMQEVARAQEISRGSSNATALAGFAARQMGDEATAERLIQDAYVRFPGSFVVEKIIQRRLPSFEEVGAGL